MQEELQQTTSLNHNHHLRNYSVLSFFVVIIPYLQHRLGSEGRAMNKMMLWSVGGVAAGVVLLTAHAWRRLRAGREVDGRGRIVVVTGCDSGIGYNVALSAVGWGCSVVATCLNPDGDAPKSLRRAGAMVVRLDLRQIQQDTFKGLLSTLHTLQTKNNADLWCLVNNAGVMTFAQCEWQTKEMVADQVEVNLLGLIHVTKALLPTLRRNKGRVVMVSSPTGQVAHPNLTVYSATKWGLEGFSHALRRELTPMETSVVIVRPCNLPTQTGLLNHNAQQLKKMLAAAPEETRQDFGAAMTEAEQFFSGVFQKSDQLPEPLDARLLACFRSAILRQRPSLTYSAAPLMVTLTLDMLQLLPYSCLDFLIAKNFYHFVVSFARNL